MERSWAVSAERLTGDFDAAERAVIDRFVGAAGAWAESLERAVHASATTTSARTTCSLGGGRLVVLDWQTVGWGAPMFDVAYLLGTSVGPETRRAIERDEIAPARRGARRRLGRRLGRLPPGIVGGAADAGAADRQREGVRAAGPDVPAAAAPRRADGARPRRRGVPGVLSALDDLPRHELPDAPDAYERYFFLAAAPDGSEAVSLVVNVHPHKGVIDAAFAHSDGDTHDSLFATDRLGDDLACGPIRLDARRAHALAADRGRGSRRPALRREPPRDRGGAGDAPARRPRRPGPLALRAARSRPATGGSPAATTRGGSGTRRAAPTRPRSSG